MNTDIDRAVVTFDLSTGREVSRFVTEELSPEEALAGKRSGDVPNLCLSPDGSKLAVSRCPSVDIWDPRTGRRLYTLPDDKRVRLVAG